MKKLLCILTGLCLSLTALAKDFATLEIKKFDGKVIKREIPVEKISDTQSRVRVAKEIINDNAEYVKVFPSWATANKGDDGYWVLGRGIYGEFKHDNGVFHAGGWNMYMPVFGMKTPQRTWCGIITGLDLEYSICMAAINGKYTLDVRLVTIPKKLGKAYEDLVIDFYELKDDDANYSGMGRLYRKYQLQRGIVKPIKERAKEYPNLLYQADTFDIRLQFHAAKPWMDDKYGYNAGDRSIPDQTPETEPKVEVFLSFKDSIKYLEKMKVSGIDKMEICSAGWTTKGYDGRYPSLFPVCEEAGGEQGLRELIKRAKELGYKIHGHAANMPAVKISPRYSDSYMARDWKGDFVPHMNERGGKANRVCLKQTWKMWVKEDLDKMADLGFYGSHYIDVFSAVVPHNCMSKEHPCTRKESAYYQNLTLAYAKKVMGGASSESGFDHVIGNIDYINYVSNVMKIYEESKEEPEGSVLRKKYALVDGIVPLWEIAYHGIVLYNPDRYTQNHTLGKVGKHENSSMLDFSDKQKGAVDPKIALKLVEFGGRPIFYTFKMSDIPAIKKAYDEFKPVKYLQTEFMESHTKVADNIYSVKYSDGSEIVCNYNDKAYNYNGVNVKPVSYAIIKHKKQ